MKVKIFGVICLITLILVSGCVQPQPPKDEFEVTNIVEGLFNLPLCGNNIIDAGEDCTSCPQDAGCIKGLRCYRGTCQEMDITPNCGNGIVDEGEQPNNCCIDVGCGDPSLKCVNNLCISKTCEDGTPYGVCSDDKPYMCVNGDLKFVCKECGCPGNLFCQDDGSCKEEVPASMFKAPEVHVEEFIPAQIGQRIMLKATVKTYENVGLDYDWKQIVGPETVLFDDDSLNPYFYAKEFGIYAFELIVKDLRHTVTNTVEVSVGVPKDHAFVRFGPNELMYVDSDKEIQKLPFKLDLKEAYKRSGIVYSVSDDDYWFNIEEKDENSPRPRIVIRENDRDGKVVASVEFTDKIPTELYVVNELDSDSNAKIFEKYLVYAETRNDVAYLLLNNGYFDLTFDKKVYFAGTDLKEKGFILDKDSKPFYVPDVDELKNLGAAVEDEHNLVALFRIFNEKTGVNMSKIFVETIDDTIVDKKIGLVNYYGPVSYMKLKDLEMILEIDTDTSYHGEELHLENNVLTIKIPAVDFEEQRRLNQGK